MKNIKFLNILAVAIALIITSCSSDSDNDVVTPPACTVDAPAGYDFSYDGTSTVSYSGQTARLQTGKTVYDVLNRNESEVVAITRSELDLIIDNDNSKLITKTAENDANRTQVINDLNLILDGYCAISSELTNATEATVGNAGWKGSYQLDARGWELDQLYAKMLIGALCLEQVNYDYLTKMDVDNADRTYSAPNVYTKREHYYDEAYGYVYGLDDNTADDVINNGLFLGKYLTKHDGSADYPNNYRKEVYDAFKLGRQAVIDNCQEVLDAQIGIINVALSKVVAFHAEGYLRSSATELAAGNDKFFHAVSEAWGFIYSLQYTKMSNGQPLFNHAEVNAMLATLDSGDGAWSLTVATLNDMADQISAAVAAAN